MPVRIVVNTPKGRISISVKGKEVKEDYIGFTGRECFKAHEELSRASKVKKETVEVEEKPEAYTVVEETVEV